MRRNALPQAPDAYETKLSPAFKPPQGLEFAIDANDPLWAQAKAWAHKNGLSQDAFMEAIDLVAGRDISTEQRIRTARDGEIAKLGPTGPARVDAIETFWKGLLGSDAEAKAMRSRMLTAADVMLHEKAIGKFASQGVAAFSQSHRDASGPAGRVDDAIYAKMSPREKMTYASQFDQSQFNGPGR